MDFPIECICGTVRIVSEGSAGAALACPCGATIRVPALAELREGAGLQAVPPSPERVIREMIAEGELPLTECMTCGSNSEHTVGFTAVCESAFVQKGSMSAGMAMLGALVSPLLAFMLSSEKDERTVHGRDTVVDLPLCLCRSCHAYQLPSRSGFVADILAVLALTTGLVVLPDVRWFGIGVAAFAVLLIIGRWLRRSRRRRIRSLLETVPEYRSLFEKFPDAVVQGPWHASHASGG